jgi:glutamine synthetase
VDPVTLDGAPALPRSLAESLTAFEAEPTLLAAFGPELVAAIGTVRRAEIALFADASPEEIAARSRWSY